MTLTEAHVTRLILLTDLHKAERRHKATASLRRRLREVVGVILRMEANG